MPTPNLRARAAVAASVGGRHGARRARLGTGVAGRQRVDERNHVASCAPPPAVGVAQATAVVAIAVSCELVVIAVVVVDGGGVGSSSTTPAASSSGGGGGGGGDAASAAIIHNHIASAIVAKHATAQTAVASGRLPARRLPELTGAHALAAVCGVRPIGAAHVRTQASLAARVGAEQRTDRNAEKFDEPCLYR